MSKLDHILSERQVTTAALSEMTGIPKRTLDAYRRGSRSMSFENGLRIAQAVNVDPYKLLDREGKENGKEIENSVSGYEKKSSN